jgi:CO/xanthine dehydrogenase FAD-binding subunit
MIVEYHRPKTIGEALTLLGRSQPLTLPLGGGTVLNRPSAEPVAVVDLQDLGLDTLRQRGNLLEIGATVTLQTMLEAPALPPALAAAIRREATHNLRQMATIAGTLVAADGRSPFAVVMLALDAQVQITAIPKKVSLGNLLPFRSEELRGRLITQVVVLLNVRLAYEYVARTPADFPIVCAAIAQWPSGRTRLALGGHGPAPTLALDGPEASGAAIAAVSAYSQKGDQWASAEYRSEVAGVLARRCMEAL